jgi:hypothetical protein
METGSFEDLRRIASIRHAVPELNGGETDYLAPEAPPGVFACLRKGPRLAVPLVNLNGTRTAGNVKLPDGRTFKIDLPPLGFTVLRPDGGNLPPKPAPYVSPHVAMADVPEVTLAEQYTNAVGDVVRIYRLSGCGRWFANTAEGAFESPCFPPHGDRKRHGSPFYRFERGGNLIWDGRLHPFGFTAEYARFGGIGRKSAVVATACHSRARVSLLDSHGNADCLHAEVVSPADAPAPVAWKTVPAEEIRAPEAGTGDRRLRTVVGGWMFDDGKLRVHLQRNGALRGVWRRENDAWRRLSGAVYLKARGEKTYDQASDVEPIATLSRDVDGSLRLSFDGVLRNIRRTGKMPDGTSYHTVCTLDGNTGAVIETSFKTDAASKGAETVLTMEALDDGVKQTITGENTPERLVRGGAVELKWAGRPGVCGGAVFLFPHGRP